MLTFCRVSAMPARVRSCILNYRHFHKTQHFLSSSQGVPGHDYLAIEDNVETSPSERNSGSSVSGGQDRLSLAELEGRLNARRALRRSIGMETVIPTSFGVIRLDAQNTPAIHGQFEPALVDEMLEEKSEKLKGKVQDDAAALQWPSVSQTLASLTQSVNHDTGESAAASNINDVTASSPLSTNKASLLKSDVASSQSPPSFDDASSPNLGEVSLSLPRLNRATLSPPPGVQHRNNQRVSVGGSDTEMLHSTPEVCHGASPQQPPGDPFEEQYFPQAFVGESSADVERTGAGNKRTGSEHLGTSLPPESPLSGLHTHTSAASEGKELDGYVEKVPGQPLDVFEEQYFFNAFEENGEREEMEAFKAGVLAKHTGSPLRGFDVEEKYLKEKEHFRLDSSTSPKNIDVSAKRLEAGGSDSKPQKRIVRGEDIVSDVDKLEQKAAKSLKFSSEVKSIKTAKDPASINVSAPPKSGPRSAADVVREMRREKAEKSAPTNRGKALRAETPQLWQLPSHELLSMLKRGVLHNSEELVVINKPFGLPIHTSSERSPHRLTEFLPSLAKHLGAPQLFTVHRLDRDTSGALLLAKTQDEARRLQGLLENGEVRKIYWAIVVGTPDPAAGVIDMVLAERRVPCAGRPRGLERVQPVAEGGDFVTPDGGKRAVTHFRTLSSASECALVELRPTTGVKHQLRSHLGLGLGFPVLGDHKYWRWKEVVPQRLPTGALQALKLRQPEARHVPLCLHSRAVWVPGMERPVTVPLPLAFKRTLKRLKLRREH